MPTGPDPTVRAREQAEPADGSAADQTPNPTWKAFGESAITHSVAHYLMTLRDLRATRGYARMTDLADALGVTKGTVSGQIRVLKEKGWVDEDHARHLSLTTAGEEVARQVLYNRGALIRFLSDVLDVDNEQAEVDACKIEHLLSPDAGHRLLELVQLSLSATPCAKALRRKLADQLATDDAGADREEA